MIFWGVLWLFYFQIFVVFRFLVLSRCRLTKAETRSFEFLSGSTVSCCHWSKSKSNFAIGGQSRNDEDLLEFFLIFRSSWFGRRSSRNTSECLRLLNFPIFCECFFLRSSKFNAWAMQNTTVTRRQKSDRKWFPLSLRVLQKRRPMKQNHFDLECTINASSYSWEICYGLHLSKLLCAY